MEKLLDLFNEYNLSPEMTGGEPADAWTDKDRNTMSRTDKAYILSKDFGWIKWLVDNDKIDKNKIATMGKFIVDEESTVSSILYSPYESLYMQLAIQDNPIEFLISYLK